MKCVKCSMKYGVATTEMCVIKAKEQEWGMKCVISSMKPNTPNEHAHARPHEAEQRAWGLGYRPNT